MEPIFLGVEEVLRIHQDMIERYGGYHVEPSVQGQRLAFFAHGGTHGLLLAHLLGWPLRPYSPFAFDETGVAVLRFQKKVDVSYPVLVIPTPKP